MFCYLFCFRFAFVLLLFFYSSPGVPAIGKMVTPISAIVMFKKMVLLRRLKNVNIVFHILAIFL